MSALGRNVKRLRTRAGLTPAELSRRAGIASVRMVERRSAARLETIEKLAEALGCTVSDLLSEPRRAKRVRP